jgi:ribosome-associated protein
MVKRKEQNKEVSIEKSANKGLTEVIIEAIQEKKGNDIVVVDMTTMHHSLFDKFIICSATSKPQSDTIIDHIAFTVKKQLGILPKNVEGSENASWCILDYFDIVVHVFDPESREFYQLEKLWADAELKVIESV